MLKIRHISSSCVFILQNTAIVSDVPIALPGAGAGFDLRQKPIAFDIFAGWLLTRRAQAHFAVSLNYSQSVQ